MCRGSLTSNNEVVDGDSADDTEIGIGLQAANSAMTFGEITTGLLPLV